MWGIDGDKTCGISDTFYITENGCGSFFHDVKQNFTLKADQTAVKSATPAAVTTEKKSVNK
jgi:Xaa-Pro dipeptidase